jgi:hypothetical protein
VLPVSTSAGVVFSSIAAAILVGAVWGRYHYAVDALFGIVVAIAAVAISGW